MANNRGGPLRIGPLPRADVEAIVHEFRAVFGRRARAWRYSRARAAGLWFAYGSLSVPGGESIEQAEQAVAAVRGRRAQSTSKEHSHGRA